MRWNFNGSLCGLNNCEQNGIALNTTQEKNHTSFIISSTLEIKTGKLHSVIMEKKNYTIQCIVEQNLEFLLLNNTRSNITIILTVDPQQVTIGELLQYYQ